MMRTFMSLRMMIGKKKAKKAETAGGSTPETSVKEAGELSDHEPRKST